jgi:aromatic-L-amino-acid/L-tryptophan decarboxylase
MNFDDGLDPANWDDFSTFVAKFVEDEYKQLGESLHSSVWQPLDSESQKFLQNDALPEQGLDLAQVIDSYRQHIRPYRAGNTHPRFFGWVQGSGTVPALMAEFAAAAMNSNCGGREHAAIYVERLVMQWCRQIFGFEEQSAGVLTSGTSASTHLAMLMAVYRKVGLEYKQKGLFGLSKALRCYTSVEAHSSIIKAIHACGIGTANLITIATDDQHRVSVQALEKQIQQDIKDGFEPFMVIANAGTVNTGAFDDFAAIRTLCDENECWMHVDGAFGAWLRLADQPYRQLTDHINMADSLAFDFHKLMYVQYDCGALLVRHGKFQQDVFTVRPSYIAQQGRALAGGDPWLCDFGLELSRSFRALKVWFSIKTYGLKKLGQAIQQNCDLAQYLSECINLSTNFEIIEKPASNIVTFKLKRLQDVELNNQYCEEIVARLQLSGDAVFSLTHWHEYRVIRASITNHRTRKHDINAVMEFLEMQAIELLNE